MNTNPTNEHREQARKIDLLPCPLCGNVPRLIEIPGFEPRCYVMCSLGCGTCGPEFNGKDAASKAIHAWNSRALSSRDAEVREVLEGLASKVYVSFKGQYCWCRRAGLATRPEGDSHDLHCQRTRDFYAKLQPKESSDVTE